MFTYAMDFPCLIEIFSTSAAWIHWATTPDSRSQGAPHGKLGQI